MHVERDTINSGVDSTYLAFKGPDEVISAVLIPLLCSKVYKQTSTLASPQEHFQR